MSIKNKEKLIKVIQEDCEIRHAYYAGGATCAVGGLAKAAGFEMERFFEKIPLEGSNLTFNEERVGALENWNEYSIGSVVETPNVLRDAVRAIEEEFGLDVNVLQEIQNINDFYTEANTRRVEILAFIAQLD